MRFHSPGEGTRVRAWCSFRNQNAMFAFRLSSQTDPREKDMSKTPPARVQKRNKTKKKEAKMIITLSLHIQLNSSKTSTDSSFSPLQPANHELGSESDPSLRLNCP